MSLQPYKFMIQSRVKWSSPVAGEPGGPGCPAGPCGPAGPIGPTVPGSPFIPFNTVYIARTHINILTQAFLSLFKKPLPKPVFQDNLFFYGQFFWYQIIPMDKLTSCSSPSPACLASLADLLVPCFLQVQVLPWDPSHPEQKNPFTFMAFEVAHFWNVALQNLKLHKFLVHTFCPSIPGKPMAPCWFRTAR